MDDNPKDAETCAVCHNPYDDPRLLSCLHSFCKSCLEHLCQSSSLLVSKPLDSVKCPLCRNTHYLPANGVDGLLPNTTIVHNPSEEKVTVTYCGQCHHPEDHVSYCTECCDFLCSLCDGAHKRMAMFEGHKLLLPEEAKFQKSLKKPKTFKCLQHSKEALQVYCVTCKIVICRDCALYSHNSHKFKPAEEATFETKTNLKSHHAELQTQLATFQSHAQEIAKVEKHVTTYPDAMKTFITSHFDELSRLLEQRKQALLNEVDTKYKSLSKSLFAEKDVVETTISSIEGKMKFTERLLSNTTSNHEFVVLGVEALSSMRKVKLPSWNPTSLEKIDSFVFVDNSQSDFIQSIGQIKKKEHKFNELTAEPKGYYQYYLGGYTKPIEYSYLSFTSSKSRTWRYDKGGTFYIEAQHGQRSPGMLFPCVTIESEVVWHGNGNPKESVSSKHYKMKENIDGKEIYEISFVTSKAGEYKFTVTLLIDNEVIQEISNYVIFAK